MRLEIGEKYVITSDPLNVIINLKKEKKDENGDPSGEVYLKPVSFHSNLEMACLKVMDKEITQADSENLSDIVQIIFKAKNEIKAAISKVTPQDLGQKAPYSDLDD